MIVNRIHDWARSQPTKPAFLCDGNSLNYAAFSRAIDATRRFLEQFRLPSGKTAILLSGHLDNTWIINLALRSIGLNTITVAALAQIKNLNIRDAVCVVALQPRQGHEPLGQDLPAGAKFVAVPPSIYADIHSGNLPVATQEGPPFGGYILYTSGTTGAHKKLFFSGEHEDKRNTIRAAYFAANNRTIYHGLHYGLWTAAGFNHPLAVWHVGGTVIFDQRPGKFEAFLEHPISWAFLDPAMLKELLQTIGTSRTATDKFELTVAGGFLPLTTAEQTIRHLTEKLTIIFGSTESCTPIMQSKFRSVDDLAWLTPTPGRLIEIVDEFGNECPQDQEGRLRVLTTEVEPTSYLDDEAASARVFRDGYFYPGDIATRRHDGRIRILGRTDDVLNIQGKKVATAGIEQEIQRKLDVDEVCLFAGQNDDGEEELVIAIQSRRQPPQSALDAIAAAYPTFGRVRFAVLDEFPRTETGMKKTRRHLLRQMVFADPGLTTLPRSPATAAPE